MFALILTNITCKYSNITRFHRHRALPSSAQFVCWHPSVQMVTLSLEYISPSPSGSSRLFFSFGVLGAIGWRFRSQRQKYTASHFPACSKRIDVNRSPISCWVFTDLLLHDSLTSTECRDLLRAALAWHLPLLTRKNTQILLAICAVCSVDVDA